MNIEYTIYSKTKTNIYICIYIYIYLYFTDLVFATYLTCFIAKSLYFRLNLSKLTDVTLPTEVSSHTLKSKLNEKILKGEYNIGLLIVPQIFKKTSIKDNSVITEEFTLQGRKIALYDIRQKMFGEQRSYMRLHTDDEIASFDEKDLLNLLKARKDFSLEHSKSLTREELANQLKKYELTRYLLFWHDGSSVSNHSHIMMMVSCMYDDGAFVTKAKDYAKHGFHRYVQSIIEKPYVYILARCPCDDHQLLYT